MKIKLLKGIDLRASRIAAYRVLCMNLYINIYDGGFGRSWVHQFDIINLNLSFSVMNAL